MRLEAYIAESHGQGESNQQQENFSRSPVPRLFFVREQVLKVRAGSRVRIDTEPGTLAGNGVAGRRIAKAKE